MMKTAFTLKSLYLCVLAALSLMVTSAAFAGPVQKGGGKFLNLQTVVHEVTDFGYASIVLQTLSGTTTGTLDGHASVDLACVINQSGVGTCNGAAVFSGQIDGNQGTVVFNASIEVKGDTITDGVFATAKGSGGLIDFRGFGGLAGSLLTGGEYKMYYQFLP